MGSSGGGGGSAGYRNIPLESAQDEDEALTAGGRGTGLLEEGPLGQAIRQFLNRRFGGSWALARTQYVGRRGLAGVIEDAGARALIDAYTFDAIRTSPWNEGMVTLVELLDPR